MAEKKDEGKKDNKKEKDKENTKEAETKKPLSIITVIAAAAVLLIVITVITLATVIFMTHKPIPKEEVKSKKEETTVLIPLRDFVVNLVDYGGRRYLKVSVALEVSNEKEKKEIEEREPMLRNYIINILSNNSFNDIKTIEGKNNLRKAILVKCNFVLKSEKVLNVYFNDFIIQ